MLIDQATIFVRSGKGGDGCVSLRREKYIPKGGPDGGDGGRGGDVILIATDSLSTLLPLTPRPHYRAKNGEPGMGRSKHGSDGADCLVEVPVGTLVYDKETGELLIDMSQDGQRFVAARGGGGGLGNERFKSATNQTPREATPGEPWQERTLLLELKLIADVGLIGKPNAGKSTLLSAVSRARPKVADYPFTTLAPHLGIAELTGDRRLVIADIPGLIEGAADGAGLGHAFLRHIERTTVLVHLIDIAPTDGSDPVVNYEAIRSELLRYSADLAEKTEIVVLNKIDLVPESDRAALIADLSAQISNLKSQISNLKSQNSEVKSPIPALKSQISNLKSQISASESPPSISTTPVFAISGATGTGVTEVLEACWVASGGGRHDPTGWTAASAPAPPQA